MHKSKVINGMKKYCIIKLKNIIMTVQKAKIKGEVN